MFVKRCPIGPSRFELQIVRGPQISENELKMNGWVCLWGWIGAKGFGACYMCLCYMCENNKCTMNIHYISVDFNVSTRSILKTVHNVFDFQNEYEIVRLIKRLWKRSILKTAAKMFDFRNGCVAFGLRPAEISWHIYARRTEAPVCLFIRCINTAV